MAQAMYVQPQVQAPDTTAKLHVTLPADATLTIDGNPTGSTSEYRIFRSPSLPQGKIFHYELKATVVRDGKTETVTKKVAVRAGEDTRVQIELPEAVAAVN